MRARIGMFLAVVAAILLLFGIGRLSTWGNGVWMLVAFPVVLIAGTLAMDWSDKGPSDDPKGEDE